GHSIADAKQPGVELGAPLEVIQSGQGHQKHRLRQMARIILTHAKPSQRPPNEAEVRGIDRAKFALPQASFLQTLHAAGVDRTIRHRDRSMRSKIPPETV